MIVSTYRQSKHQIGGESIEKDRNSALYDRSFGVSTVLPALRLDTVSVMFNYFHRLKSLINQAPVMLFMKGDRDTPRCGFSKQTIQILKDTG